MTEGKRYTEEDFAEVDRRIELARKELIAAQEDKIALTAAYWRVPPGTEVVYRGERYLVSSIYTGFAGPHRKPWLKGRKQTKGGSWGAADRTIYSEWEHASSPAPSP